MEKIMSLPVCIIDNNGNKLQIGSARIEIKLIEKTMISRKEKRIILRKLDLSFKEGEDIYNNGGWILNLDKGIKRRKDN